MRYEEYEAKVVKRSKVKHKLYRFRFLIAGGALVAIGVPSGFIGTKGIVNDVKKLDTQYTYGQIIEFLSQAFLGDVKYEFKTYGGEDSSWKEEVPHRVGKYTMRSKSMNSFNSYYYGAEQNFEIIPKDIELAVKADSYTYGDVINYEMNNTFEFEDKLVSNVSYTKDFSKAGQVTITPAFENGYLIQDKNGNDVTSCYKLTPVPKTLEFKKRPLKVSFDDINKVYDGEELSDDQYNIVGGSLVEGDYFVCQSKQRISNVGSIKSSSDVKVFNSKDEDVSSFYDLDVVLYSINIEKRDISFSSENLKCVYDGKSHQLVEEQISIDESDQNDYGLLENDKVVYQIPDTSFTDAGKYDNEFTVSIFSGDKDVTDNYNITYNYGQTTIEKRPISLASKDKEFVYDSEKKSFVVEDISFDEDESSLGLVEGHDIEYKCEDKDYTNAGEYDNEFTAIIKDGDKDVTKNYNITYNYGKTTINKRPISIKSTDKEFTYDGEEQAFTENDIQITSEDEGTGLVESHSITYTVPENHFVNVGAYDNDYSLKITSGDEDVTANYDVSQTIGKTTINKRPIAITSNSNNKTYDGSPFFDDGFTIDEGSLANKDKFGEVTYSSFTNAGTYANELEITIVDKGSGEKVNDNYDIALATGKIEIAKRDITIQLTPINVVYDDKNHHVSEYTITSGSLAEGESLSIVGLGNHIDAGVYNEDESTIAITRGEKSTLNNYNYVINGRENAVTITKRPITIVTKDVEYVYNATNVLDVESSVVMQWLDIDELIEGHYFDDFVAYTPSGDSVNVGVYSYRIDEDALKIFNKDKKAVKDNYEIDYEYLGSVTITKRPVTISLEGKTKTYDGTPLSCDLYSADNLVEGHYCDDFENLLKITHTWESAPNSASSVKIYDENDNEVTFNYNWTISGCGNLVINPRPITFVSSSISKIFDAKPIKEGTVTIVEGKGTLAAGDSFDVNNFSLLSLSNTIKHVVQSGSNTFTPVIYNSNSLNVTPDYLIGKQLGTLTINPLPLTLGMENEIIIYDGADHAFNISKSDLTDSSGDLIYIQSGTLPETYSISATISIEHMTYVDDNDYAVVFEVSSTQDTDIDYADYEVKAASGHRYIAKRPIQFSSIDGFKIYDGQPFGDNFLEEELYWVSNGSIPAGDVYTIVNPAILIEPTVVPNNNTFTVLIKDETNKDVTYCYNISYNYGSVIIYE